MPRKTDTLIVKPNNEEEEKEIGTFKINCAKKRSAYREIIMGWIKKFNGSNKQ